MTVKLLTEHHLEFLSLKGGCTCLSESTLAKMPYCWKSHVRAHNYVLEIRDHIVISKFSKQAFNESLDFCNRS